MSGFAHTPYDDGKPPFTIGLHPLDLAHWLEVDGHLPAFLEEKERVNRLHGDRVFMAEAGTEEAQREVLDTLLGHLARHHCATHRVHADHVEVAGRRVDLGGEAALRIAGSLVQEDLVLMRRNGDGSGWRIAAASLCFPSSWSLRDKFGKALVDVHAPVPGFQRGTRNAMLVDRIFDKMQVEQPVWRTNFSLYDNDALFHPEPKQGDTSGNGYGHVTPEMFIRVEYQTLRKMPVSGDILFTIRIHLDPMQALARHPERERLCDGLAAALNALDAAQLLYKGLDGAARDHLAAMLRDIAATEATAP